MDPKSQRIRAVHNMKQNLILDAALTIIAKDGYHAARLEDIADEAGFSKASLYHYFPDREALVLQLVLREQNILIEKCGAIVDRHSDAVTALREIISLFFSTMHKHSQFHKSFGDIIESRISNMATIATKHSELFQSVVAGREEISGFILQVIELGLEQQQFTTPLDSKTISTYVQSIIQGIFMQTCMEGYEQFDVEEETDKLLIFLTPLLAPKSGETI